MNISHIWDVVVVGGGAAGFFSAITYGEKIEKKKRILIIEKSKHTLTKVKISGGGRCNVTHRCFEPRQMAMNYPRGNKALIGPLHQFGPAETIQWFRAHGVDLKTESDGRMFPITDDSQTIIDCLYQAAQRCGVQIKTGAGVQSVSQLIDDHNETVFALLLDDNTSVNARKVIVATGGTRLGSSEKLGRSEAHACEPAIASLFSFHIQDHRVKGLQGLSVTDVELSLPDHRLISRGALLITHRGISGPAVLKLSAWGARELYHSDYRFPLVINWLPDADVRATLDEQRSRHGGRLVISRSPFEVIPKRLWQALIQSVKINQEQNWADLSKKDCQKIIAQLRRGHFQVNGKSTNKDEFVTCGGVSTDQLNMKTMESRHCKGLYFVGEVLDVDGITGGFNFQNAWTTGFLAGSALAASDAAD